MDRTVVVNEMFKSIQGESTRAGLPCTMVRLTGCNLRCRWCDTSYAWEDGKTMGIDEVLRHVDALACQRAEVTGGEPLIQAAVPELLKRLCENGYETLLETNGSQDISRLDPRVARIVDFKCPGSGAESANRWQNVSLLTGRDEVKFIVADRGDYEFALAAINEHNLLETCPVTLSPAWGQLDAAALAEWIVADYGALPGVRLGLQLHKLIWPQKNRGV